MFPHINKLWKIPMANRNLPAKPNVFRIRDFAYPEGLRLAVNFTVDFDAMLNRRLQNEPVMELSQGEFGGRVGVWRLLELFDRHGIKATFFTPGRICELYPRSLEVVAGRGHEVANHMWEHRVPDDPQQEWDHLTKTTKALEGLCGKQPVGTRSGHGIAALVKDNYVYRSSMSDVADELPYYVVDDDGRSLLALPVHYSLDDAMYHHFSWYGSPSEGQHLQDPDAVYRIWSAAFDHFYRTGGYMNIVLHNFVSGRASRVAMLERLIVRMKRVPGVWFATCEQVATHCLERFPLRLQ